MKFGVVLFGMILFLISPLSAAAEQRPGPEATQHALDELANAVAQGRITLTPTQTPTLTPTPIPTATATVTEVVPTVIVSPTATPVPILPVATGDDPIQGYLRPTDSWLELAIPQGRWFVYSDTCDLQAWNTVWLWNNGQDTYLNDCHIDTSVWSSTTPCAQNDDGICDIQLDQSYWDYLGSLPTPTETPAPSPTLLTHINVLSTVPPVRQPEPVVQPTLPPVVAPTPITQYVQSPPQKIIQTMVVTKVVTATPTASPTATATRTPTIVATPTVIPPTPTPASTVTTSRIPGWLQSPFGIVAIACLLIAGVIAVPIFMHLFRS